ncbi:adenylate cyclase type 6-like X1 [Biomphalaria pfeifferi]|uniref:Adenylate cyclase type 6-like X1 n=1 Tax=Biomphalaria pfeifferi TaxID=112525 RepID=A0AAD8BP43_BIOPF|nr:adenylate cyclase type 6-like X1 [Biomphalaria pfeifferi]
MDYQADNKRRGRRNSFQHRQSASVFSVRESPFVRGCFSLQRTPASPASTPSPSLDCSHRLSPPPLP